MKHPFILLIVLLALISCDNKSDDVKKQTWDPTATITIRAAKGVKTRADGGDGLTALEIVQQAKLLVLQSEYFDNKYYEGGATMSRGFFEHMKDFETPALKMLAIDVISAEGEYYRDLTYATDVYITSGETVDSDTIAYIPDAVIANARLLVEAAFAKEDYEEVYRIFNEAFTFLPVE